MTDSEQNKVEPLTKSEFIERAAKGESFAEVKIGDLIIEEETLRIEASLDGAIFVGEVSIIGSKIISKGDLNFGGAIFKGNKVSFSNSTFECANNITFTATHFAENSTISFYRAKFHNGGQLQFLGTRFSSAKKVDFTLAEFNSVKGTKFNGCHFEEVGKVSFIRAKFYGEGVVSFISTHFNIDGLLEFNYVYIEYPELMEFIDTNLSKALLLRTDLRKIKFRRVIFSPPGRIELYDFINWNDINRNNKFPSREFAVNKLYHIGVLYTQLKQNFESDRDYSRAGEFHVGEMEMRRKQYNPVVQYISILNLYRGLSNYGESWKKAIAVFLAGTVLFTILNLLYIEWPHSDVWTADNISEVLSGFADSWISTLDLVFPGRILGDSNLTKGIPTVIGKFLLLIESIFGPLMLALIILALRRHTKR